MTSTIEIRVPDIGTNSAVPIIEITARVGDNLAVGDPLMVLESDKATMDVPTDKAGTLVELLVSEGDEVTEGTLIAKLELTNGQTDPSELSQTRSPESTNTDAIEKAAAAILGAKATTLDMRVPDLGDSKAVPIIEICIKTGDQLAAGDTIAVLESDKATMDIPCDVAGTVLEVLASEGDEVIEGSLIAKLAVEAKSETAPTPAPTMNTATAVKEVANNNQPHFESTRTPPQPVAAVVPGSLSTAIPVYSSPSIRRYARTLGVAIESVIGTGPKGRITREDVEAFVKLQLTTETAVPALATTGPALAGLPDWPTIDFEKFGPIERTSLNRITRISGPALTRNSLLIPHVCNFDEADITSLESFRQILNTEACVDDAKITMLAFTVKAAVAALKAYPIFNSSLDVDEVVLKQYWHIGVAADTPEGLVVPVIRDADRKSLREIANEMQVLAAKARRGRLSPAEMSGATFTISSLGGIGGTGFTPIINAPEVAILGMTRAKTMPHWTGSKFEPRLIQPLSLSWDHRVVDGVAAAKFLQHLSASLTDFRRVEV